MAIKLCFCNAVFFNKELLFKLKTPQRFYDYKLSLKRLASVVNIKKTELLSRTTSNAAKLLSIVRLTISLGTIMALWFRLNLQLFSIFRNRPMWWRREKVGEYFPIFTKDHAPLTDYLKSLNLIDSDEKIAADDKLVLPWIKTVLDFLRDSVARLDPVLLMWSVFSAGCAIMSTGATITPAVKKP